MAMSIFARVGTIKGESRDAQHKDEIEALSWSWGLSRAATPGRGGGAGIARAGRPTFHDFTFTHRIDRASPALMTACATGQHIADAAISVRKAGAGQQDYLLITMKDVVVTGVSTSLSAEADDTTEIVVLEFGKVDFEYRPQQADGKLEAGVHFVYDLKAHH
ncbi:type VI secretion system tube protein Hcp [Knoellia locipacati]|uniref:Hcp family type VI secretion system effector n=1 Tax=Knoellia locipacati TaxID=882824 RepID=UPI00384B7948